MTNYIQMELAIELYSKIDAINLLAEKIDFNEIDLQPSLLWRTIHCKIRSFFGLYCKRYLSEKRSVFNYSIGHYEKYARQNFSCYYQQTK